MVPGARIELATPAFSGRRSTNELPRQLNFSSLVFAPNAVKFRHFFPILMAWPLSACRRREADVFCLSRMVLRGGHF